MTYHCLSSKLLLSCEALICSYLPLSSHLQCRSPVVTTALLVHGTKYPQFSIHKCDLSSDMHVCWPSLASLTPLMSYKKRQRSKSQLSVIACSQTEAPQMPYVLRTAQIRPWTNTTLTQPLTIRPHLTAAAPTLILAQVGGPSMPLLS